jgi:hypothetical protein
MGTARGVDHGLGGKDNAKSREKRARKAERQKTQAQNSIVVKKNKKKGVTKEIVFDEDARLKYLTEFRQRKTERRKYGLAMQILKDKQMLKDVMKQKRNVAKEVQMNHDENVKAKKIADGELEEYDIDEEEEKDEEEDEEEDEEVVDSSAVYADDGTVGMFGGSVAVQIDTGVGDDEEVQDADELKRYMRARVEKAQSRELSRFDKAVRKVQQSGILSKKAKQRKPKSSGDGDGAVVQKGGGSQRKKGARPGSGNQQVAKYAKVKAVKGLVAKASAKAAKSYKLGGRAGGGGRRGGA